MNKLIKLGKIKPKNSKDIKYSKIGLGFEKLDRDAFNPEKAYDKVAACGRLFCIYYRYHPSFR